MIESSKKAELAKVLEQLITGENDLGEIKAQVKSTIERVDATEENLRDLIALVEEHVQARPKLHVQINNHPEVKLSSRPNPEFPHVLKLAKLKLFPMLIGPAGVGKTTMAKLIAEALNVPFAAVCLTAGASEAWLFGRQTPTGFVEGPFSKIYRDGGVFLADEMDAADANLLLSINTALSHKVMLNPMNGEEITRHPDFIFIGAANTNGRGANQVFTGRIRLDGATLDRVEEVNIDYDRDLERELCPNPALNRFLTKVRFELKKQRLDEFISTRKFVSAYRQIHEAGIPFLKVIQSISNSWSDAAKACMFKDYLETEKEIEETIKPDEKTTETEGDEGTPDNEIKESPQPPKRGRGRPRKNDQPPKVPTMSDLQNAHNMFSKEDINDIFGEDRQPNPKNFTKVFNADGWELLKVKNGEDE